MNDFKRTKAAVMSDEMSLHQGVGLSRRHFLRDCGYGLGKAALAGLLSGAWQGSSRAMAAAATGSAGGLMLPQTPHHQPRVKRVIHLFMAGAPSHLEMFDYKPELKKLQGKPIPPSVIGGQRYAFIKPDAAVLGPQFGFSRHGQCGMELSDVIPGMAGIADELCLIRSVHTDQFNHAPAQMLFQTGFPVPGRPSMGSWALYGLGSESQDLPAFVVMSTGAGISGGPALWSSGFMPTMYTGVRFRNSGDPILNVANPKGYDRQVQRDTLDLVGAMNRERLGAVGDPEIATRIAQYEMAFRMQASAPELTDLKSESQATLDLYGCKPDEPSFARACLLARRMIERGVRFINIFHEGWDAHSDVAGNVKSNSAKTDRASAALVMDLKQRGLLDDTLVVWGGEFGRTPMVETNPALGRAQGRDHHPQAYSIWMAGGGLKKGLAYGSTDDLGFHSVENPVHVHDVQATVLHLLGFDHERLTYRFQGRDYRLTDIHGKVVTDILS